MLAYSLPLLVLGIAGILNQVTDKSFNVRIIAATNEDLENCGRA